MRSYFSLQPCSNRLTAPKNARRIRHTQALWTQVIEQISGLSIVRTIFQSLCGSIENSHIRSIYLSFGQSSYRTLEHSICRIIERSRVTCLYIRRNGTNRHLFSLPQFLYLLIVFVFNFSCFPSFSLLFSIPFFYAPMDLPLHTTITATDCI